MSIMSLDRIPRSCHALNLNRYRSGVITGPDATNWILEAVRGDAPCSIWSLSDGDTAWWCYDHLACQDDVDREWLAALALSSGLHSSDRTQLGPMFDRSCRNAEAWLVQFQWEAAERFTMQAFTARGVKCTWLGFKYDRGLKPKIDCNSIYRLHEHGQWWKCLAGQRLAIVSQYSEDLATRLLSDDFVRANGGDGVRWTVGTAIQCPPKSAPKADFWPRLVRELHNTTWSLLLCSAGGLSALACDHVCDMGRKGLDIGAFDGVLLGRRHGIATQSFLQTGR